MMGDVRALPLLSLALILVGCSKGNFNDRSTAGAAVLTYPLENKVTTLDPGKVQDAIMPEIMANVFEGLVAYDEKNVIAPALAERWDVTDGGKTYVFRVREAKFQDGTPLTAEDFKRTWERNLSPALASPIASGYLGDIVGVKEYADGKAKEIVGVKVIDPHTLSVTLDKPRPYFLGNLTYPCAFVLPKTVGAKEIRSVDKAVGTGPFKLTSVVEDQQIDLTANEGYWGGKPKVGKIARPVVIDNATRLSGFKNGQYDFLQLPRSDVVNVQNDPKLKPLLHFQQRPAVFYFLLNQKEYAPFKDARVRKAFAMAINREQIVNDLLTGQNVANGLVPPGVPGFQEGYKGLPYDPEGARKLLAEAGYPGGKGLPKLELDYRSARPDSRVASEAVATALQKVLGVPISTKALELGALVSRRNNDQLQMAFMSWNADYLDPQNFLSLLMTSNSKLNHDGFNNPEFDRLCAEADVDQNPQHRMALYRQAERIAVEQAARLPLYFEMQPILIAPYVRGLRQNLFGVLPHTKTEIVPLTGACLLAYGLGIVFGLIAKASAPLVLAIGYPGALLLLNSLRQERTFAYWILTTTAGGLGFWRLSDGGYPSESKAFLSVALLSSFPMLAGMTKRKSIGWPLVLLSLFAMLVGYVSGNSGSAGPMLRWLLAHGCSDAQAHLITLCFRKTVHFTFYGTVGWTALQAARQATDDRWAAIRTALLTALSLAAFDELRQSSYASRTGTAWDVLLDFSGAIAFVGLSEWWRHKRR